MGQLQKEQVFDPDRIEAELFQCINKERLAQGRPPLLLNPVLNRTALAHSKKMAEEKKLSHHFPGYKTLSQRLMAGNLYFLNAGENIAFSESVIGKYIHQKFMASAGHRQNILDATFTHCGIKVARADDDYYVTQVFAHLYTPQKNEDVEKYLEKELTQRFRQMYSDHLVFFDQLKPYARIASKLYAADEGRDAFIKSLPDEWGKISVFSMVTPQPELIGKEIGTVLKQRKYSSAAVGVSQTRDSKFPGGAYSVSIFLLDLVSGKWTETEVRQLLLAEINRLRREAGLVRMVLDERFSCVTVPVMGIGNPAPDDWHPEQLEQVAAKLGKPKTRLFNYRSYEPGDLPAKVRKALLEFRGSNHPEKIAIMVYLPLKYGKPGNYFQVAMIF
jgi:hypothetical protein